jgi:hypothetical protein
MCLTGDHVRDLILLLFAALLAGSNHGDRRTSRLLARCCSSAASLQAEMLPRQVSIARSSINVSTDEI